MLRLHTEYWTVGCGSGYCRSIVYVALHSLAKFNNQSKMDGEWRRLTLPGELKTPFYYAITSIHRSLVFTFSTLHIYIEFNVDAAAVVVIIGAWAALLLLVTLSVTVIVIVVVEIIVVAVIIIAAVGLLILIGHEENYAMAFDTGFPSFESFPFSSIS